MMWYYAFAAVVILHKYMYTVSASLQYAHSFFKMTIWGAFNSNFEQVCAFSSRELPKKWTFYFLAKNEHSIQITTSYVVNSRCDDADTVCQKLMKSIQINSTTFILIFSRK